jgi:hypothetical protein
MMMVYKHVHLKESGRVLMMWLKSVTSRHILVLCEEGTDADCGWLGDWFGFVSERKSYPTFSAGCCCQLHALLGGAAA